MTRLHRLFQSRLLQVTVAALAGVLLAWATDAQALESSRPYFLVVAVLLAVGLYGTTYNIDNRQLRADLKTIILAVTVGVLLKAAFISSLLYVLSREPLSLLLGVIVAQIDPLSVAAIMNQPRLSKRAKAILAAWSSFDDPITVILAFYASFTVVRLTHPIGGIVAGLDQTSAPAGYVIDIGANIAVAVAAFAVWRPLRGRPYLQRPHLPWGYRILVVVALTLLVSIAVWNLLMLGIAIAGLFIRPPIGRIIDRLIRWALLLAAVMLGLVLKDGVELSNGLILGVLAFAAQILVSFLLTIGLPSRDRIHLALAQQNGITAILLALLFEPSHPGTVAIVAPAIFFINGMHALANGVADRFLLPDAELRP